MRCLPDTRAPVSGSRAALVRHSGPDGRQPGANPLSDRQSASDAGRDRRPADSEHLILDPNLRTLRSRDLPVANALVLSISLPKKNEPLVGYQARSNTPPIDLRAIGGARISHYWDRIHGGSKPIILEPDEFYIFASRELVRLPPEYCAEMVAFDASSGEVRTHYAGFFDCGFGYGADRSPDETAAAVVLEVRSRDVPFLIEDGQPLFRVHLLRSAEPPDMLYGSGLGSNYQGQRLRLSKQFTGTPDGEEDANPAPPGLLPNTLNLLIGQCKPIKRLCRAGACPLPIRQFTMLARNVNFHTLFRSLGCWVVILLRLRVTQPL